MTRPDDAADRYGAALDQVLELALLVGHDMDRGLAADGLTPARAHLLWELAQRGPTTQRVLAEALRVSPRNVTGLVDGLETSGLVVRAPHPTDRRAALVTFTDRGREVAERMVTGKQEFAAALFGGMDSRRFAGLAAGLDDVLARMRALVEEESDG